MTKMINILHLIVLMGIIGGHEIYINNVKDGDIIGRLGVPIYHRVVLEGRYYEELPGKGFDKQKLEIRAINGVVINDRVVIDVFWPRDVNKINTESIIAALGYEKVMIGRGGTINPDSAGMKRARSIYIVPPEDDEWPPQSDWGHFEIRSTFIIDKLVEKR